MNITNSIINILLLLPEGLSANILCEVLEQQGFKSETIQQTVRNMLDKGDIVLGKKLNFTISDQIKRATNIICL